MLTNLLVKKIGDFFDLKFEKENTLNLCKNIFIISK